jgi:hypothetical protein
LRVLDSFVERESQQRPGSLQATRSPGADEVQLRLLEGLEKNGIRILEVYEGGPEAGQAIAAARDGR